MHRLHRRDFLLASLLAGGSLSARRLSAHEPTAYSTVNLISDIPGLAQVTDPNVTDAWGFASSAEGPVFLVNTRSSFATTYRIDGRTDRVRKVAHDLPVPESLPHTGPTDVVYNNTDEFVIGHGKGRGPAKYIMSVLDGTIAAWRPGMTAAVKVKDSGAMAYTGIALGRIGDDNFLYLANCAQARVDVYDEEFNLAEVSGGFANPDVPPSYMPFNVQNIGGRIYVAYAVFNGVEEEKDMGKGIVAVFNTDGELIRNIAIGTDAGGEFWQLNAPWGFAIAPDKFGDFSGTLLVGNFGDGAINAFDRRTYEYLGQLPDAAGGPLKIDGLWAMSVGNGAGSRHKLYFCAGPNNEADGLFGYIGAR